MSVAGQRRLRAEGQEASAAAERRDERARGARDGAPPRRRRPQARRSSRAASASGSRSRARSSTARACCCSTSRSARSTSSCARRCRSSSSASSSEVGITFVYVTHDQDEALSMSDRLAVFNRGRIEQVGTPARGLRAPGRRVRRRVRRRVERPRARRAPVHDPPREDPDPRVRRPRPTACRREPGTVVDTSYTGAEHALRGRARRRRHDRRDPARTSRRPTTRPATCAGSRSASAGASSRPSTSAREADAHPPEERRMKRIIAAAIAACPCLLGVAGVRRQRADNSSSTTSAGFQVPSRPIKSSIGAGEGALNLIVVGRLRRGRLHRPEGQLGHAVREEHRLQGQREDGEHLRRDGDAHAHRPLRRRLGVGQRVGPADRRRRRRPDRHEDPHELTRTSTRC